MAAPRWRSGHRPSRLDIERFRAKWVPVRVKKTRQNERLELSVPIQSERKRLQLAAECESRECQSSARGLHRNEMVVGCAGRRHPALGQARDRELLLPLRGQT